MTKGFDIAATVVIDCLDALQPGQRPLVIDETTGALVRALGAGGAAAVAWWRGSTQLQPGTTWPAAGPFSSAFIRLPKVKEALDFALHAAASVVPTGAPIVIFGANDEGVRSVASHLESVAYGIETVATKRHCRVLAGVRRATIDGLKPRLEDWRVVREIEILGARRPWVSYPGVFARGRLDEGTALLIAHLPKVGPKTRLLDFAGGTGIIMAAALQSQAAVAAADLLEIDALALAAAAENVPGANLIAGDGLTAVDGALYDLILSNPPFHEGVTQDKSLLHRLIADSPRYLRRGSELRIVVQRHIAAAPLIEAAFKNVTIIAGNGRYQVLSARKT